MTYLPIDTYPSLIYELYLSGCRYLSYQGFFLSGIIQRRQKFYLRQEFKNFHSLFHQETVSIHEIGLYDFGYVGYIKKECLNDVFK